MAENIFTDFLDDEIQSSQPISLPSSSNTELELHNINYNGNNFTKIRPPKLTGQCGGLRSIEEIEQKYRSIFNYQYFNLVQSKVIEDALYTDKSMVVCAPTGSGKTVVFEMAIVQLLMEMDDNNTYQDFKIIYMAPIKALCTERLTEWYPKFTKLNHLCIEVTGDTDVEFTHLKPYRIIITTPEKWDMLTRRWKDNKAMVELIKLFLIDEVHILNEPTRGPVLEAVVSRMKTVQTSMQSVHRIEKLQRQRETGGQASELDTPAPKIRFVAVSATISNPEDVAEWLSTSSKPAVYYKFGDECRPVKLKRIVEGYPCPEGTSIFKFDIILNYKLWPIIQKYHNGKPTLIFCNTRKSVLLTAEALSREITINFSPQQRAKLVAVGSAIKNKKVQTLVTCGVGCHHAGLLFEERTNIEQAFRNGDLPILITTTTLAMGVNLPAHLVIIKNTQQYVNGAYQEYSISTVLQMVGRAGRPQFDSEATAVIMTRLADKGRYQALVGGCEPLQSYLHKRLAENLNSEAALGTVSDVAQCVQWLRSTFLYVRASRDPKKYLGLPQTAAPHLISKKIEELCVKAMNGLASSGLITMDEASCIESTEAGRLMSIHYLDLETMKHIRRIKGDESLEQLLWIVCESHELSDMHLRVDERRCLNALNRNASVATIRFPIKGKITNRQMKLNCVIQAVLGCLPILEPSLNQESLKVMRIADRICKCLVAYVTRPSQIIGDPKTYQAVLSSIVLGKCVKSHLWENSVFVSKQLKGIGPAFSTLLAAAGKVNFMLLEESHPRDLERVMNKGPPSGNILRKQISLLPKYQLTVTAVDENSIKIQLTLLNQMYLAENMENLTAGVNHKCYVIIGDTENCLLLLTSFMDKDLIGIYNGQITLDIKRRHNFEHKITAHCISSNFVGIDVQCEYQFGDKDGSYKKNPKQNSPKDIKAKVKNVRQAAITDTFKIRKRKIYDVNETLREKKKCKYAVVEKIEPTSELFLDKMSSIDENIVTQRVQKIDENTKFPNFELDDEDYDKENYDDATVNCILNEIEKEIYCQENVKAGLNSEKNKPSKMQHKKIIKSFNELSSKYRNSEKSNYTFLENIEKKTNVKRDQCYNDFNKNTFADSVKTHIDMFLEKTKQRSKVVSNFINLLEINEPASVDETFDNETNENNDSLNKSVSYDKEEQFKEDGNITNLVDIKEPDRINNINDDTIETYKEKVKDNIEAKNLYSLCKNQSKTLELNMSLRDTDNTDSGNNASSNNFTDKLNDFNSFNKDDENDSTTLSKHNITSENQQNNLNQTVAFTGPISDQINSQNSEKLSNLGNGQIALRNSNNCIQQNNSNDIESIFKSYSSLTENPIFHGNHIECNINQITYTMGFPLTKTASETEHKEEKYPTNRRNITNVASASDKVETIKDNQIDSNCLAVAEIYPDNGNKIDCTSDEIEKNKSKRHCTSASYSNCLAIKQKENTSHVIHNPLSSKMQVLSGWDSRFFKVEESNFPNISQYDSSTNISTKTISITKTQVNIYSKNKLERKYCVMSQFKFDLDIAESDLKVKYRGEPLKQEHNKYKNIKHTKMSSIEIDKSLIQPLVDIPNNNSNVVNEQEIINESQVNTSTEVKDDFKQEDSRVQKNRSLNDIIQKYKNIMSSKRKVLTPTDYKSQSKTASKRCEKIKRPFKITDLPSLHEPNIEFQNGLYGTQKPIYFSPETRKDIIKGTINNTYHIDEGNLHQDNYNMKTEFDCIEPQTEESELNNTFDISQSMFNPKTVLECFKEDIIPPPSQFRDDGISGDPNKICGLDASSSNFNQTTQSKRDIFENVQSSLLEGRKSAELSKQTETWTLSRNDDGYTDPCKSFDIRNKSSINFGHQMTRKSKLNKFKFSPKSTFNKRRK